MSTKTNGFLDEKRALGAFSRMRALLLTVVPTPRYDLRAGFGALVLVMITVDGVTMQETHVSASEPRAAHELTSAVGPSLEI
jgi:hypothetical protein